VTPGRWVIDSLLKRALIVRNGFSTTSEAHLFTEIISAFSADATLSTWYANLQGDSITNAEASYLRADCHYFSGRLVTERQRLASTEVAVGEFLVVADIRTTYAGAANSNLELTNGGFLQDPCLLVKVVSQTPHSQSFTYLLFIF
jgi:hypothetical protein